MKTVTPTQLADAYCALYPNEGEPHQHEDAMANWLARYEITPDRAIANANWYGKVTRALFHALNLKRPRTVSAMRAALACPSTPDKGAL